MNLATALQLVTALLILLLALLALGVARERSGVPAAHRAAWIIVAVAYLWRGIPFTAQAAASVWAFEAGPGSWAWETFVRWTPALNHGRTMIALVLGWVLAFLPLLRRQPDSRLWWGANASALVLSAAGMYMGWQEGGTSRTHVSSLAILAAVELVGLLAALLVGLAANTMDRCLWIVLCAYAVHLALKATAYSATSYGYWDVESWAPWLRAALIFPIPVYLLGIGLAWQRWSLARRGIPVPGLFEEQAGMAAAGLGTRA